MKYIIDIEDESIGGLRKAKNFNTLVFDQNGLDKLEPYDNDAIYNEGYKKGVENGYSRGIVDGYNKGQHECNESWKDFSKFSSWWFTNSADTIKTYFPEDDINLDNLIKKYGASDCLKRINNTIINVGDIVVINNKPELNPMIVVGKWIKEEKGIYGFAAINIDNEYYLYENNEATIIGHCNGITDAYKMLQEIEVPD